MYTWQNIGKYNWETVIGLSHFIFFFTGHAVTQIVTIDNTSHTPSSCLGWWQHLIVTNQEVGGAYINGLKWVLIIQKNSIPQAPCLSSGQTLIFTHIITCTVKIKSGKRLVYTFFISPFLSKFLNTNLYKKYTIASFLSWKKILNNVSLFKEICY